MGVVLTKKSELTKRELEVASLISEGKSNKIIAYQLGITYGTVKETVNRVFKKLNCDNRVQLALIISGRR